MAKDLLYEWNELSDTREMLEARTAPFITYFLGFFLLLLAGGIGWACTNSMDIVVKAQAVVRPNNRISTLSSNVQGKVTEILYQSGQHVKEGDVLLRIGLDNMAGQRADLQAQYDRAKADAAVLSAIEAEVSAVSTTDLPGPETGAWGAGKSDAGLKWKVLFEQNENDRMLTGRQLDNDTRLLLATKENRNPFQPSELYYEKYETYRLKIEQLESARSTAAEAYKQTIRSEGEAGTSADHVIASTQRDLDSFRSQYWLDLNTSINEARIHLQQLRMDRENLLVQLKESDNALQEKLRTLSSQLNEYNLQISERTIKATSTGVINVIQPFAAGDLIEVGTRILSIVPEDGSQYVMQLAIANRDIGSVKPGTKVKFDFLALPAKEYGHLSGTMKWLGPDALVSPDNEQSYYAAESSLNGLTLRSQKGNAAEVKVGMVAEAHMITDRESVIHWLLKKINLWN